MEREIAAAGIEQDAAIDTAVDRTDRRSRLDGHAGRCLRVRERRLRRQPVALERRGRAGGQGIRDAIVGRADDAADRCRSVAHRRRTADDFDLVCRQRIDRHEMVFAEIGSAAGVGAVFEDADAIDVETPDDRPARGAGREGGAGNAGFGEQEIAELGGALAADFLVRHHRDGRKLIGHDRAARPVGARPRPVPAAAPARAHDCGRARCGRRAPACAKARRLSPHDRAWRRHGDFRQLRRGGGAAASWAIARLPIAHSNSQLAPPKWNARFFLNVIVPILIPSMATDRFRFSPGGSPRWRGDPLRGASINRCQEAGGARDWNADAAS